MPSSRRTALVVHGGGLRSICSCATLSALNQLGLSNAFDEIFAVSSGGVNAAYFLTEQAALGLTVYMEDVNNRRFLNFFRVWKMLDLEYFFDEIVQHRRKHDTAAMQAHPTELKVITTDRVTSEARWFSSKDTTIDFYAALKAACSLPAVYPGRVKVQGRRYIDGGYREPLPLLTPVRAGVYTDILVAMTTNVAVRYAAKPGWIDRFVVDPILRTQLSKAVFSLYRSRWKRYNEAVDIIEAGFYEKDGHRTRVAFVCPDVGSEVGRFEKDRDRLAAAAFSCWSNTFKLFGVHKGADRSTFDEVIERAKLRSCSRAT